MNREEVNVNCSARISHKNINIQLVGMSARIKIETFDPIHKIRECRGSHFGHHYL